MAEAFRCGLVAVVGRPNVGKSTLVNRLIGRKVSIVSPRPQTTRCRVMGVHTQPQAQIVYIDTPGLHAASGKALNRCMNRVVRASVEGTDAVLFVIEATGWRDADDQVLALVRQQSAPVLLVINKIDALRDRTALLPLMQASAERLAFAEIVPVSALTGEGLDDLERTLMPHLPEQPPFFPSGQVSDREEAFLAAELVREELFRVLRQELPYALAVGTERFEHREGALHVHVVIWVEKAGQKGIVIGRGGERLKQVGTRAREQMEQLFGCKVYLETWVKVREGWTDNEAFLRSVQYGESG